MNESVALLLSCQDVHEGRVGETLSQLVGKLNEIPDIVVQRMLLPKLCDAAANSDISRQQWFFSKPERPQILETVKTPLTSVYGGRITCWKFLQTYPVTFMVTGHGPGPVCARVSSIVCDLAKERNCTSDIVAAGFSFFDLTANPSRPASRFKWDENELARRVTELARRLDVAELLGEGDVRRFLVAFAGTVLQPTIEAAAQSLAHLEAEMGFVVNKEIDAANHKIACDALNRGVDPSADESFPILVNYKSKGAPLRLKLPLACLGIEDYDRVVDEYRRTVLQQMQQEWERRRRKYEAWSYNFVHSFQTLRSELMSGGMSALSSRTIYIHYEIDPTTATEKRLDPPQPKTEFEYLRGLPLTIIQQLAYWAWANYKIESLPEDSKFRPHWERTCLVDAFLRGWPLPSEDEKLNTTREEWEKKWRPLALAALDSNLRQQGLSLSNIAVENTIFRVVTEDDDCLTLEVLHIWDPSCDQLPHVRTDTTLFAPTFGKRQKNFTPAKTAQQQATQALRSALRGVSVVPEELQQALCLDSGEVVDALVENLCRPFTKDDLESDIERVKQEASNKIDPLTSFHLHEKLGQRSTLLEALSLAKECGEEGRKRGAVPDFLAWELYLAGECVRSWIKNALEHIGGRSSLLTALSPLTRVQMPRGVDPVCIQQMSQSTSWQIVKELLQMRPCAGTVEAIFKSLQNIIDPPRLRDSFEKLKRKDSAYANKCLDSDGRPAPSPKRETSYAPGCFSGWDRICYDIAEGDAALGFAWIIRKGSNSIDKDELTQLIAGANSFPILSTFDRLASEREKLLKDLAKFKYQSDSISMNFAGASVQQALTESLDIAKYCYQRAATHDSYYGCGWLRLAKLKWLMANFRESLSTIIGPAPKVDLQNSQLPLAIAVRTAGGNLSFAAAAPNGWNGPASVSITTAQDQDNLTLDVVSDGVTISKCAISGLSGEDISLLTQFFQKYQPDMLHSAETKTIEEWVRLIQVPNLGQRAAIAAALQGETRFALETACVSLGVPDILGLPPDSKTIVRLPEWLKQNVVTSIN